MDAAPQPAEGVHGTKWAEVDVAALRDNAATLCDLAGDGVQLMAMVKANGYGHGTVVAARAALAGGAAWLGVSSIAEALELRGHGLDAPILNVGWTAPWEMSLAAAHAVDVTVFELEAVAAAASAARDHGRQVRVHWKVDTGMARLGTRLDRLNPMLEALRQARPWVQVVSLYTHFADADGEDLDFTHQQHRRFGDVVDRLRGDFPDVLLHAANSAALLRMPESRHDMVRVGIALYGYLPPHCTSDVVLRRGLSVHALITQVKDLAAGESVGYGRAWTAARPSRIATVAAGYADGVDRRNTNRGRAIAGGVICPMVGRVSMDQLALDVTDAQDMRPGDEAVLIGERDGHRLDASNVGAGIGTIPNEVLCAVSARVPRILRDPQGILG